MSFLEKSLTIPLFNEDGIVNFAFNGQQSVHLRKLATQMPTNPDTDYIPGSNEKQSDSNGYDNVASYLFDVTDIHEEENLNMLGDIQFAHVKLII